jgi:hypothetical protein
MQNAWREMENRYINYSRDGRRYGLQNPTCVTLKDQN